ncbi:MAG: hypothetical protein ABXS91_08600 [Sulfurimonas sp.]
MKNKIENIGNGQHKVSISFDITDHGHTFGMPRNYNLSKVQKLIRSKDVQETIKNGYAICMYGHGSRHKNQGYIANERNHNTGDEQEPIGKVTALSIRDKIITYEALLVETIANKTLSVVKMIESGIGGFSFVWDVNKGIFYGSDFVLSPNFNGNRVMMDSICSDGQCMLGSAIDEAVLDAIGDHGDLYDEAKDLLQHQDNVMGAIKFRDKIASMQDSIDALQKQVSEQEIMLENKDIDIQAYKDEVKAGKGKLFSYKELLDKSKKLAEIVEQENTRLKKENEELSQSKDSIEDNLKSLHESFSSYGLKDEDGTIVLDESALGSFMAPTKNKFDTGVDKITMDSLRSAEKRPKPNPLSDIQFSY